MKKLLGLAFISGIAFANTTKTKTTVKTDESPVMVDDTTNNMNNDGMGTVGTKTTTINTTTDAGRRKTRTKLKVKEKTTAPTNMESNTMETETTTPSN